MTAAVRSYLIRTGLLLPLLMALLAAALWLYLRYFSILGCRQCGDGDDVR